MRFARSSHLVYSWPFERRRTGNVVWPLWYFNFLTVWEEQDQSPCTIMHCHYCKLWPCSSTGVWMPCLSRNLAVMLSDELEKSLFTTAFKHKLRCLILFTEACFIPHIETLTSRNFRLLQAPLPVLSSPFLWLGGFKFGSPYRFSVRSPVFNLACVFLCSI